VKPVAAEHLARVLADAGHPADPVHHQHSPGGEDRLRSHGQ
jgi:hypothetical protein